METNDADDSIPDVADLPVVEEGKQDTTDWKAQAQTAHEALKKAQGIAKRFQTKLSKLSEPKAPASEPAKPANQQKGFDYAEKAYLKSSGINADEFDFVKEVMDATGKTDIDAILGSKYFQAELKERRDLKATEVATPSGTKRAGNTTRDQVDYWIAKGELPPADQAELRRAVVNARIKSEKSKTNFTSQAVVK
jgi:hypothetical protein